MSESPRTPGEARLLDLAVLVVELRRHRTVMVHHRHGLLTDPLTAEGFITHALAVLSIGQALAEESRVGRWVYAREALSAGADLGTVAAAMSADPDELRTGLVRWADGQRRHGLITAAELDEVYDLLGGAS